MFSKDRMVSVRFTEEQLDDLKSLVPPGESLAAYIRVALMNHVDYRKRQRFERYKEKPKGSLGDVQKPTPVSSRNSSCPCGSGKKYKRCCGSSK